MSDYNLYVAVSWCGRMMEAGGRPAALLEHASTTYRVPAGQLAMLVLVKRVECDRARALRNGTNEADEK